MCVCPNMAQEERNVAPAHRRGANIRSSTAPASQGGEKLHLRVGALLLQKMHPQQ